MNEEIKISEGKCFINGDFKDREYCICCGGRGAGKTYTLKRNENGEIIGTVNNQKLCKEAFLKQIDREINELRRNLKHE